MTFFSGQVVGGSNITIYHYKATTKTMAWMRPRPPSSKKDVRVCQILYSLQDWAIGPCLLEIYRHHKVAKRALRELSSYYEKNVCKIEPFNDAKLALTLPWSSEGFFCLLAYHCMLCYLRERQSRMRRHTHWPCLLVDVSSNFREGLLFSYNRCCSRRRLPDNISDHKPKAPTNDFLAHKVCFCTSFVCAAQPAVSVENTLFRWLSSHMRCIGSKYKKCPLMDFRQKNGDRACVSIK